MSSLNAGRVGPRHPQRAVCLVWLLAAAPQLACGGPLEQRLFQYLAMQQHPTTGLLESYTPNPDLPPDFLEHLEDHPAFLYDNSLAVLAWLDRAGRTDRSRARRVLDAFLSLRDPESGGLPDAVNAVTLEPLAVEYATGNQMWAVLALLEAHRVLGDARYLEAAEALADFAVGQKNPVGYGGFRLFPGSSIVSTEHNADAYAAFSQLAMALAAQGRFEAAAGYRSEAAHARIFVESRFDPTTGRTFAGTDDSGVFTVTAPVPEDTQTWTILALGGAKWRRGLEWMLGPDGLWTRSSSCPRIGPVEIWGPSFSDADLGEVWVEGLAHLWVAGGLLREPHHPGRRHRLPAVTLRVLQRWGPHADGRGLIAACGTLDTGFGFSYHDALALAPTAWAIFGARNLNPFWDRSTLRGRSAHPGAAVPWAALDAPPDHEFTCPTGDPCLFTVSGESSGVADQPELDIHVLIRPIDPPAGGTYTQMDPATVWTDGTWSASAQVGSGDYPAGSGDAIEVSAVIVDATAGSPPPIPPAVTPDGIPGLVAVTGVLPATVRIEP